MISRELMRPPFQLVGRLEDGMETLEAMISCQVNDRQEPIKTIVIAECGRL
jgi:hypothetical protein